MDTMTPLDAAFLDIEDAEPDSSLAIASVSIFDGPCPSLADVTALVQAALPETPRYRQVIRPVPYGLGTPRWVDHPAFDVQHHVLNTALPRPGGSSELQQLVGRLMAQRLPRDRPLWQVWLVEGLADDHWALVNKVHHCMVDGIAGMGLLRAMLSETPSIDVRTRPNEWTPIAAPSDRDVVLDALQDLAREPVQWGLALGRLVRHPRSSWSYLRDAGQGLLTLSATAVPAHATSLVGPAGRTRRYRWTHTSIADVATVRAAFGGTMNDVVLSVISGGFRALLLSRGERCDPRSVRSLVPVSVRTRITSGVLDNEVSAMVPYLPVDIHDPVRRLQVTSERMTRLKDSKEALAGEALIKIAQSEPPPLVALAVRTGFRLPQRSLGTVTTNVPGPRDQLYALGRPLLELYPYVPIASTIRFGIALTSYRGRLSFGITGDFESTSDIDVMVSGIDAAMSALVDAARESAAQLATENASG